MSFIIFTGESNSKCETVDGPKVGQSCVFPFVYQGQIYEKCILKNFNVPWCSTKTDINGEHLKGNWGICHYECDKEDGMILSYLNFTFCTKRTLIPYIKLSTEKYHFMMFSGRTS